jgi:hypothetical protein
VSEITEGCQNNIHTADDGSKWSLHNNNLPEVKTDVHDAVYEIGLIVHIYA